MAPPKLLRLLALVGTNAVVAQIFANGPFQLHISSLFNASIDGDVYPCQDTLALCFEGGVLTTPSTGEGFIFTSRGKEDYTAGYLSWRNDTKQAASNPANTATAYGPIGLIYDPGTNVAVPVLNQTSTAETFGFDSETGNLMMAGIDDTAMSNGGGNGTDSNPNGGARGRNYNNWYLCFVQLDENNPPETLVSWVLGANRGWLPTNPTCQPINITMQTSAVGYGDRTANF
ncbi:hypothetical protein F4776DRAFT_675179 [Hypoxylon sp. NC0597]|nr:hypothetical protein F4776DRAFT_675179 [Hypoxylon sp. NC0597]